MVHHLHFGFLVLQSTLNLSDVPVVAMGATNPTAGEAQHEV